VLAFNCFLLKNEDNFVIGGLVNFKYWSPNFSIEKIRGYFNTEGKNIAFRMLFFHLKRRRIFKDNLWDIDIDNDIASILCYL